MVWLHYGGNTAGWGAYAAYGASLSRKGVVYVGLNYRLGDSRVHGLALRTPRPCLDRFGVAPTGEAQVAGQRMGSPKECDPVRSSQLNALQDASVDLYAGLSK
ncbi:MAG: hypothetical protein HY820_12110 [Acidobacteria bacterium]|nr:hypothetical protein [Acidobacteriota bacterium]